MLNKIDIINRLMNGESVDDIALEIAATLNEAEAEYKEAKAKREEEKKLQEGKKLEEEAVRKTKEEIAEHIVDDLCDYYAASKNDSILKLIHEIEMDSMIEALDELGELYRKLGKLEELEFKLPWLG